MEGMSPSVLVRWVVIGLISAPIVVNHHLRNVYRQTLAHWLSKVVPPPTVFVGDSIMTGGTYFDDIRNINLAANSLTTDQIAMRLKTAKAYRPKRIVIMAGMNDAIRGFDPDKIRSTWEWICKEPNIVVTLVTPSQNDEVNRRIDQINRIAIDACYGKPIIAVDVGDESGQLKSEFAIDDIHLGPKGYERWIDRLRSL